MGGSKVKRKLLDGVAKYHLDEAAIEAEAFRLRSADLMRIEQLRASAEARRDKALHSIAFYRQSLAQELRDKAVQVIQTESVPLY
jgi:hypothetical protein